MKHRRNKRKKSTLKNRILKALMYINIFVFIAAACVDSNTYIPVIICAVTLFYLIVFSYLNISYANNWFERECAEND